MSCALLCSSHRSSHMRKNRCVFKNLEWIQMDGAAATTAIKNKLKRCKRWISLSSAVQYAYIIYIYMKLNSISAWHIAFGRLCQKTCFRLKFKSLSHSKINCLSDLVSAVHVCILYAFVAQFSLPHYIRALYVVRCDSVTAAAKVAAQPLNRKSKSK